MHKPDVLIVGAGPTGLMMACQLARLGIPFRIIEKNQGPNRQSRALAIHAASMEIFSQLGIADQFEERGKQVRAVNYLVKGKVEKRIPLSEFGRGLTQFPFLLVLEQSKTEKLLVAFLENMHCKIEWETELVNFSQHADGVNVSARHTTRGEEKIVVKWLVGADGAKSKVRQILNIPFGGETYPVDLFVLDCKVSWPLQEDEMYIAFSDFSFAGFFPMPEGRCRVIGFVPENVGTKDNIAFDDVSNKFAERMQMDVKLSDPDWISTYRSHHRYVSEFKSGRCFVAGDAAHIHSPVGAQGMNTGLQDAFNLAWKLAFVLQGKAKTSLLSTYQEERLPFARQLVKTTDNAFSVTVSKNSAIKFMRMYVAPRILAGVLKIKFIERLIFKTISQIGMSYANSAISQSEAAGKFSSDAPKPGERLPFVEIENNLGKGVNIQQQVNGLSFHLFLFSGTVDIQVSKVVEFVHRYNGTITLEPILLANSNRKAYKAFGVKNTAIYLVRPDLHIAFRSGTLDTKALEIYLNSFLIPQSKL